MGPARSFCSGGRVCPAGGGPAPYSAAGLREGGVPARHCRPARCRRFQPTGPARADELGFALTVRATEVAVGEFHLDIQAEDEDGRVVVIENQLGRTDHGHLGQCLVYASGLDPVAVVWVSTRFREEFRRAFDWLNERTDLGIAFFGVEVGVVQIGDQSPRAPVFEVVSRPNNWQKAVKASGSSTVGAGVLTAINAARQDFFGDVLTDVIAARPAIRRPSRFRRNWVSFASGPFGCWALAVAADGRLRVELYLDMGDRALNEQLFDELHLVGAAWETQVGMPLVGTTR
jgi:Domain of unknown function (DUF4268)